MSNMSKRALRWAAPVALVGAIGLAACGDGDSDSDAATANVPTRVYDYLASDDHRVNASTAEVPTNSDANIANPIEAGNRAVAVAEQIERQAHLDGQAKTHSSSSATSNRAAVKGQADAYVDSLEARAEVNSNRAATKAQADAYVDSLEARAEDSGPDDEFVPGTRHMPMR
jgi:hypothetical protein